MNFKIKSLMPYIIGGCFGVYLAFSEYSLGPYIIPNLILMFISAILIIFIHEMGHALTARFLRLPVYQVKIGGGRELFKLRILGIPISITSNFAGGYTVLDHTKEDITGLKLLLFMAGGLLFQLLFLTGIPLFFSIEIEATLLGHQVSPATSFFLINALFFIISFIPMKGRLMGIKVPNDSLRIVKLIFKREESLTEFLISNKMMVGFALFEKMQYEEAAIIFEQNLADNPNFTLLKINLSAAYIRLMRLDEAEQILIEMLGNDKDRDYILFIYNNLAYMYLLKDDQESLKKADEFSEKAFKIAQNMIPIQSSRGCVLIEMGQIDEGMKLLTGIARMKNPIHDSHNPPDPFLYLWYAFHLKGQKKEADVYFSKLEPYIPKMAADSRHLLNIITKRMKQKETKTVS